MSACQKPQACPIQPHIPSPIIHGPDNMDCDVAPVPFPLLIVATEGTPALPGPSKTGDDMGCRHQCKRDGREVHAYVKFIQLTSHSMLIIDDDRPQ